MSIAINHPATLQGDDDALYAIADSITQIRNSSLVNPDQHNLMDTTERAHLRTALLDVITSLDVIDMWDDAITEVMAESAGESLDGPDRTDVHNLITAFKFPSLFAGKDKRRELRRIRAHSVANRFNTRR